jgi:hypothetical protein
MFSPWRYPGAPTPKVYRGISPRDICFCCHIRHNITKGDPMSTLIDQLNVSQPIASMSLSVPSGYTNIRLILQGRSSAPSQNVLWALQLNNDAAPNYLWQKFVASNTSSSIAAGSAVNSANMGEVPGALALPNMSGVCDVFIANYLNATFFTTMLANGLCSWDVVTGSIAVTQFAGIYLQAAPVTQVAALLASGLWVAGSNLQLWAD